MKAEEYFANFPCAELCSQDGTSRLRLCSYGYEFPDTTRGSDADWHRNYIALSLPGFRVEINEACLEGRLLTFVVNDLRAFSALRQTRVDFKPTEPYFGLSFSLAPMKKVMVEGYVQYPVGIGAKLNFAFETDLTYLDKFIEGLQAILAHFPVKH